MHDNPIPDEDDRADAVTNADATGLIANQTSLIDFEMQPIEADAEPLPDAPDIRPG